MTILDMNAVRAEEERLLASFSRRLVEIAARAGAPPTAALAAMRVPAIALDGRGFVADVNTAAEAVFANDIKIKDRRLLVCDPHARALLEEAINRFQNPGPGPYRHSVRCPAHGQNTDYRANLGLRRDGAFAFTSRGLAGSCNTDRDPNFGCT